ncbi:hypothetical protein PLANTIT3_30221 [Plantibacter sp. T3]|nr:hypothetical protein PLANTIT3_30221 [Plantibacter sp. T3]
MQLVRRRGRRRLHAGCGAMHAPRRHGWVRHRHGRDHVLGSMPRVPGGCRLTPFHRPLDGTSMPIVS